MTALHLAARFSSASITAALVKAGAEVNARDDRHQTPLHCAVKFNTSADVIRKLIECGADVDACDDGRQTPLHNAAWYNRAVVPVLVELGAKVNVLGSHNRSPLYGAAFGSFSCEVNRNAVIALCAAGAEPNLGVSPLEDEDVGERMKTLIRKQMS